ncbi:hypothetical protein STVA_23690 [Allostella vacuolata]|nr:hypothetical protein STVA_23690 [Stella vacuolata]
MPTLGQIASAIRSRPAGADHAAFDVIFHDRGQFEQVRDAALLTPDSIADLLRIPVEWVTRFRVYEPGNAIQFTIRRDPGAGDPAEAAALLAELDVV